jgi:hypothetical protein
MGTYISFLIRLWREDDPGPEASAAGWKAQVEHIQSGRHWTFQTLEEALVFLRPQVKDPDALSSPIVESEGDSAGSPQSSET